MLRETLAVPPATSDPVAHADWLELRALTLDDLSASHSDLVAELRRTGSVEAVADEGDLTDTDEPLDEGSEVSQAIADAVFAELEDRSSSAAGGYPFAVDVDTVAASAGADQSLYSFLLCLSTLGGDEKAGIKPRRLFEDVSASVVRAYFGAEGETSLFHFGFPRRIEPPGFRDALTSLCKETGEGVRAREGISIAADQKDATLDLVVWKRFPDRRPGSLMGFGQCATGADWIDKTSEMQPRVFSDMWTERPLVSQPTRMFLVPHRIDMNRWELASRQAGVVLDRCRMAWLGKHVPALLLADCATWTEAALAEAVAA